MPKAIPQRIWTLIESAYMKADSDLNYEKLGKKYSVSISAISKKAAKEKWAEKRLALKRVRAEARQEGAKAVGRKLPRKSHMSALDDAIAELSLEAVATEAKSKEGCVTAMVRAIEAYRTLFPPSADELAAIAVQLGISPQDFLTALKKRWEAQQSEAEPSRLTNG